MDTVERRPDALVIVALDPAGKGDAGARRDQQLRLGAAFRGDELAAVDHGGGQGAMADHRARARAPARAGHRLIAFGGTVAAELERIAALDQADAPQGQLLQLDRADFGAVLLQMGAALRLLILIELIELALDAVDLAVEDVDEGPQQIVEVLFEPRTGQHRGKRVSDGADLAAHGVGIGQRTRIRLILERAVAVERQLVEEVRSRRERVRRIIGFGVGKAGRKGIRASSGSPVAGRAAPIAAFTAIPLPETDPGRHPQPALPARAEAQRRMAAGGYFGSRCKAGRFAPGGGK